MTGWCPYKTGTLEEQECHFDGYCSECPHNKSDTISRQAAKNRKVYSDERHEYVVSVAEIDWLPAAQPEQRWVPCSEALPEDGQKVLYSTKTGRVHSGVYYNDGSVNPWYSHIDKCRAWNNVVIAWQPLPEPYKESGADMRLST